MDTSCSCTGKATKHNQGMLCCFGQHSNNSLQALSTVFYDIYGGNAVSPNINRFFPSNLARNRYGNSRYTDDGETVGYNMEGGTPEAAERLLKELKGFRIVVVLHFSLGSRFANCI